MVADEWFKQRSLKPFQFQRQTWKAIAAGKSGLLNSPTGSGKTFAIWFGILEDFVKRKPEGLHAIWITPLRALSGEMSVTMQQVANELGLKYKVALRTGDTTPAERARQKKKPPQILITTPESIHVLMATKGYDQLFSSLEFVVVDEWHELLGSKRGVQVELALSRLTALQPRLKRWGISATIGNLEQAMEILLGKHDPAAVMIRHTKKKVVKLATVYPDVVETYSWVGHLGTKLIDKIVPLVNSSRSTLIFVNVRSQAEKWYQELLSAKPEWAGELALHHGSLSETTRRWVERQLRDGKLRAVVCTSSLDLGVDFHAVDTVIQVGSPKGVARMMQRAGRSGHQPGATSRFYFVPTNSLEIIEGAALREAIDMNVVESRIPHIRSFDVLLQYMVTLAVSDGFVAEELYKEITSTHCFRSVNEDEFNWCVGFLVSGGSALAAYDEYRKLVFVDGKFRVTDRAIALRHRLSIGTIVSDTMMHVKFMGGKSLGMVEENFISRMVPGDVFWFAGRNLELISIRDMEARVRPSKKQAGPVPSWLGGRLPLSGELAACIRDQFQNYLEGEESCEELVRLHPLLQIQKEWSGVPSRDQLLIEQFKTREGHHLFVYPFAGRFVHEGMAAILAYRIGLLEKITFSIAMNDYGFELLSDRPIDAQLIVDNQLFSSDYLEDDISKSVNLIEMAMRRFRDIATIAGLVFTGYPGKQKKTRHLQASSQLFFKVFGDYDRNNLLLRQAYDETLIFQLEITRMREAFQKAEKQEIIVSHPGRPTPFSFPLLVDTLREKFSNEDIQKRIDKILQQANS